MVHSALNHSQQRMLVPAKPITAPCCSAFSPANKKICEILPPPQGGHPHLGFIPDSSSDLGTTPQIQEGLISDCHGHSFQSSTTTELSAHADTSILEIPKPWEMAHGSQLSLPVCAPNPPQQARSPQSKEAKAAGSSVKSEPATVHPAS